METYKLRSISGDKEFQLSSINKYESVLESLYTVGMWHKDVVISRTRNKKLSDKEIEKLEFLLQKSGWIILSHTPE
jgi:hypothetical protein